MMTDPTQPNEPENTADNDEEIAVEVVADADADSVPSEVDELAEAQAKQKDTYERLLRTTADLDNARKRHLRELVEARAESKSRVLLEVLPVIDNLERALQAAQGPADGAAIIDGVQLVLRTFEKTLEKLDVRKVEALGLAFDPAVHEAMSQVETTDVDHGAVATVLQSGYTLAGRLLRPAMVVVAKAPPESEDVDMGENDADVDEVDIDVEDSE